MQRKIEMRVSERGVGKAAVIMDEKTRRGWVDSVAWTRQRERGRKRDMRRRIETNEERQSRARQSMANAGPEGSCARQRRGAASRQEAAATNRASEPRRSGMKSSREAGAELRRVEQAVGCGGDVAPVVFYLLKTSSELDAGRIPQLES